MSNNGETNELNVQTHHNGVMGVYTGKRFDLFNIDPNAIDIMDIAHPLSLICRFGGHIKRHYSVAQHCLMVEHIVREIHSETEIENGILDTEFKDRELLHALLHDASEAYMCDIPRPLKYTNEMTMFRDVDNKIQMAINKKFGLPEEEKTPNIALADEIALSVEGCNYLLGKPSWADKIRTKNRTTMYLYEVADYFRVTVEDKTNLEIKNMFLERFYNLTSKPYFS
jgi:5'-deoxynucleotidase YfbR-like HD superfamily hydrolase